MEIRIKIRAPILRAAFGGDSRSAMTVCRGALIAKLYGDLSVGGGGAGGTKL